MLDMQDCTYSLLVVQIWLQTDLHINVSFIVR